MCFLPISLNQPFLKTELGIWSHNVTFSPPECLNCIPIIRCKNVDIVLTQTQWITSYILEEISSEMWIFSVLRDWNWTQTHNHLNFRFCACFEQGFPWLSGNYRVWIHSETSMWHDKNIQSNALYRIVLTT